MLLGGWCTISSFPGLSNFCRSFKILHYHFSPAAAGKKTLSGFYDSLILANSGLVSGLKNQFFNFTFFPVLLILASQRIEDVIGWDWSGGSATKRWDILDFFWITSNCLCVCAYLMNKKILNKGAPRPAWWRAVSSPGSRASSGARSSSCGTWGWGSTSATCGTSWTSSPTPFTWPQ